MSKPFGVELLLDLYGCVENTIDDINVIYNFLMEAVAVLGVSTQAPPYVFHSPPEFPEKAGISAWVPLIESGIQCHTLTAKGFVSIDYYTCSDVDEEKRKELINLAKNLFCAKRVVSKLVVRGADYYAN